MYRGPSPIFDVPEFPPLRRVKPLPKRRRTSAMDVSMGGNPSMMDLNAGMNVAMNMNMGMGMGMSMGISMGMGVEVGAVSDLLEYQRGMATTTSTMPPGTALNHQASSPSGTATAQDNLATSPTIIPATAMSTAATTTTTPSSETTSSSSPVLSPHSPPQPTQSSPTSLSSYYMPMSMSVPLSMSMFNNVGMGMQDLFRMGLGSIGSLMNSGGNNPNASMTTPTNSNNNGTSDWSNPTSQMPLSFPLSLQHPLLASEYPGGFAIPVGPSDEDDHGDGDYVDHLQHPGNTKKRKVPAANGHGHNTSHTGSLVSFGGPSSTSMSGTMSQYVYPYGYNHQLGEVGDEDPGGNADLVATLQQNQSGQGQTPTSNLTPLPSTPGGGGQTPTPTSHAPFMIHKNKTSAATLAGLQHKDLLKTRKRQLAAVLGALSHGDTLALDQALSARYIGLGGVNLAGMGSGEKKTAGVVSSSSGKENLPLLVPSLYGAAYGSYGYALASDKERRRRRRKAREGDSTDSSSRPSTCADPSIRGLPLGLVDANTDSFNETTDQRAGDDTTPLHSLLPSADFTFACPSLTSERLVSTREEVAVLHARFESELSRQAAKAAEAAAARQQAQAQAQAKSQNQQQGTHAQGRGSKRVAGKKSDTGIPNGGGEVQNNKASNINRTNTAITHSNTNNNTTTGQQENVVPLSANTPLKSARTKKKKRSALANASNPHHLRNYVPSRMPHSSSGGGTYGQGYNGYGLGPPALGLLSPLPATFLMAEIAPRDTKTKGRKSKNANDNNAVANGGRGSPLSPRAAQANSNSGGNNNNAHPTIPLILPEDEWICPFCEYYLFYGDDASFKKAIKWRKKILNRRRRARERAAAAASGTRLTSGANANSHSTGGGNVNPNGGGHAANGNGDEYDDSPVADGGDPEEYPEDREHEIDQEYHEHFKDREKDVGGIIDLQHGRGHNNNGHAHGAGQKTRK